MSSYESTISEVLRDVTKAMTSARSKVGELRESIERWDSEGYRGTYTREAREKGKREDEKAIDAEVNAFRGFCAGQIAKLDAAALSFMPTSELPTGLRDVLVMCSLTEGEIRAMAVGAKARGGRYSASFLRAIYRRAAADGVDLVDDAPFYVAGVRSLLSYFCDMAANAVTEKDYSDAFGTMFASVSDQLADLRDEWTGRPGVTREEADAYAKCDGFDESEAARMDGVRQWAAEAVVAR